MKRSTARSSPSRRRRLVALAAAPLLALGALPALAQADDADADADFRALLFTRAVGYVHDSIPDGIRMMEEEAAEHGFELVETDDPAVFNDEELAGFDVVVMLQNSGMVWETDEQRAAIQGYVQGGGGIAAIHNTLDMGIEEEFPWWDDLVNGGAHMPSHSPGVLQGTAHVADDVHPSTSSLPEIWERPEEWYNFDPNPRGEVHVLVTADESTYDPGGDAMGHDHPISWCREDQGGQVWATAMGHDAASYAEEAFRDHVIGGVRWAAGDLPGDCGGTVWSKFDKVTLDANTADPMELDVADDGRVFYVQRGGELKVFDPETNSTSTAGTLDVYTGGEDGLVGLALDPDFTENGWVYLYHAPADAEEDVNRLSRFTVEGDTLDPASEEPLLDVPAYRDRTYPEPGHTGGSLDFGPDGSLYLSTGDDVPPNLSSHWQGWAPIDWREGEEMLDAARTSGNTNDLRGKILRVLPSDEGGYTVPEGNLFAEGTEDTLPEIYAMGFRNPFRFSVDPETGYVHVADYGPDRGGPTTERGPEGLVEYNILKEPGNYGWPFCHGNNQPYAPYDPDTGEVGEKFDCANPTNPSPNNTGLVELPPNQQPEIWYGYGPSEEFPEMGEGGSGPMAGPVYRYDPDNPSPTKFPEYYDGAQFLYEWTRDYVKEIQLDSDSGVLKINDFLPTEDFVKPMDLTFGPDGSLYVLEWGSAFGGGNADSGLYRIDYAPDGQRPEAVATASVTSGPAPLTVEFSGADSTDPAGGELEFAWDLDGDGTFDSEESEVTHTYEEVGQFTAQLRVTNAAGATGHANIPVTVGNTAPTVSIDFPTSGRLIEFGDQIPYQVTVTDPEDGEIDCEQVLVNPALGHDDHEHPTTDLRGCSGTVDTGDLGGHPEGADLWYVLNARYTDGGAEGTGALTGYGRAVLQPEHKQAEYHHDQSGTRIVSQPDAENGQRIGDISDGDWIAFEPMSVEGAETVSYRISSPDGGGAIELRAGAPDGELLATTPVHATGDWDVYEPTEAVPVAELAGTHKLFLVFTTPTGNNFDVDSLLFTTGG
ncbi:Glucose/arabinose dehydrogenase, beta-propeller fold [Streptomyces zhaozhouensis]|uniref:Glucose/arabinose dehydrogenase, beta-propeller fold n=1 Tax=Streptomyces zhaozhouensis TaxID=1300267 RepID=A0A286DSP0_9ACTN|nr:ThuA domain-containing protein [Streptomyces zhaozhouensis]SOD61660.1 Glucose/arabinose dehydrogenase, beta-propeller fold [Streptomyces zhaozhouensis]